MTPSQILSRVRDTLKNLVWPGTSNQVFGVNSVYVISDLPIQQIAQYVKPCAFVIDQGDQSDPEHPGLITQNFAVMLYVENVGNEYGEGGILGRNRTANTSQGAGTKDIEEVVLKELIGTTALSSAKVVLVAKARTKPQFVGSNAPALFVQLVFQAFCWVY